jgi:UDP-N-acetyl-D-glucosamine/UDP-N-acetyl-D-galactosamine dehydrogenase
VDIFDPWANEEEVKHEYGLKLLTPNSSFLIPNYNAVVLAVAHEEFKKFDFSGLKEKTVVYDIKAILPREDVDRRL